MTGAHIVIMILFAIAMVYYTIKWQKRRHDSSAPVQHPTGEENRLANAGEAERSLPAETVEQGRGQGTLADEETGTAHAELSLPEEIMNHYRAYFHTSGELAVEELTDGGKIAVLQFPPVGKRAFWVSATCGLSATGGVELILYSADREAGLGIQLTDVATQAAEQYVMTGKPLQPGFAFALQSPIVPGSSLISLYTGEPLFEEESFSHFTDGAKVVRFLMLHAISAEERAYLQAHGPEALEALFVERQVNSVDFFRPSAIVSDTIASEKG